MDDKLRDSWIDKKINKGKSTLELQQYYYLYSIRSLYAPILPPRVNSLVRGFKKYFHPHDDKLSDEERLKYAYFYCALSRYETAKKLVKPIALRDNPNIEGLKFYISLMQDDFDTDHERATFLIQQFPKLGKYEWCDLWKNKSYLNALMLEDLRLKEYYNCNCN